MIGIKLAASAVAGILALVSGMPAPDEIREQQWHLGALHIDQAHTITKGKGVIVGLIDTGVDATHPDLAGSVLPGFDATEEARGSALIDVAGHGTSMAGLIVAHGRALGIAPEATVLPVRGAVAFANAGAITTMGVAIDWAVDHGATVLCLAFGSIDSPLLKVAIERAIAHDVIVIAAIGNFALDGQEYPARYPGVVAATGTDRNGGHAAVSATGSHALLAAPANDIMSTTSRTVVSSGYKIATGTSESTAIIAGVTALIRAKYPDLSAADVINRMTATADDKGPPGRDNQYGYGIVNPVKALTADIPPLPKPTNTTTTTGQAKQPTNPNNNTTLYLATAIGIAALITLGLILALRRRQS